MVPNHPSSSPKIPMNTPPYTGNPNTSTVISRAMAQAGMLSFLSFSGFSPNHPAVSWLHL